VENQKKDIFQLPLKKGLENRRAGESDEGVLETVISYNKVLCNVEALELFGLGLRILYEDRRRE
jgi:hypothetical protein